MRAHPYRPPEPRWARVVGLTLVAFSLATFLGVIAAVLARPVRVDMDVASALYVVAAVQGATGAVVLVVSGAGLPSWGDL
jgi:hypothetical protein